MKKLRIKRLLVLIAVLAIIAGIVVAILKTNNKKETINEKYFILSESGKYGIVDENGDVIIKPQYESVQLPNPEEPVFICLYEYNSETADYKSKILNEKGEQILTNYENVMAIEVKDTTQKYSYRTTVLKYKENNKFGLLDLSGKKITEAKYDSISNLEYQNEELIVVEDGKYGVIKTNGKELIKPEFENITADKFYSEKTQYEKAGFIVSKRVDNAYKYGYFNKKGNKVLGIDYSEISRVVDIEDENNTYIIAKKNGKAGLLKNKKEILNFDYSNISFNYISKVFLVEKEQKLGVMNINGKEILPIDYDEIIFSGVYMNVEKNGEQQVYRTNGKKVESPKYVSMMPTDDEGYFITLNENNLYGVVDNNEQEIIPNNYEYIQYAFGDYFIVSKDGKLGVLNLEGKSVLDIKYDMIDKVGKADILQATIIENESIELYNNKIEQIGKMENAFIYEGEDYIKLYSENDINYFSIEGKKIANTEIFSQNKIHAVNENGKWGFANKQEKVVECKYDMVTELNEHGYAGIMQAGMWGVINSKGEIVIEPTYELEDPSPDFIGKYYKVYYGYGQPYYTNE